MIRVQRFILILFADLSILCKDGAMLFRGFWENLEKPIIGLAPMDGVTDAAFRYMVCKYSKGQGHSAGTEPGSGSVDGDIGKRPVYPSVIITEFTNVEGLARGATSMLKAFIYNEIERPIVAQIYGVEPESYYKCAVMLCAMGFDGIDINMGCPANKVAKHGSGAGLIKTPELAKKLVLITKKAVKDYAEGISLEKAGVHPDMVIEVEKFLAQRRTELGEKFEKVFERRLIPVSVKTRIGYESVVAEEWVKHLIEVGPANISMHGRTLKQMYTGKADWETLAKVAKIAQAAGISFLGNGDVKSMQDAREKIEQYGVDGVLAGRALFGNPWFFTEREPVTRERLSAAIEHARYFENLGHLSFHNIKKHLAWYCKEFEGARELRMKLMLCCNFKDMEKIMKKMVPEIF